MILARQLNNFLKLNKTSLRPSTQCFWNVRYFSTFAQKVEKEISEKKTAYGNVTPKIIELAG